METKGKLGCIVCLITSLFLTSCAEMNWPKVLLNTQDFPPFSYETDEVVYGPAAHIIKKVCTEAKIRCSFKLLDWKEAQEEVKAGIAQGMFVIGWNAERAKWLYFSPPLLETEYGLFVEDDSPLDFKDVSDLSNYTVAAYGPSNTYKSLERIKAQVNEMKTKQYADDIPSFEDLSAGKVDAVYSNKDVGKTIIAKLGLQNIRYAGTHRKLNYYVGFSKQSTEKETVDRFNATFRDLHKKGVIQEILVNYQMSAVEELD